MRENVIDYPDAVPDEATLDELLGEPHPRVVEMMRRLAGDIVILGVAGKMGVSLAAQAVRACELAGVQKTVYGVARFSDPAARTTLEACGAKAIPCDLMDRAAVAKLPRTPNVIFMAGRKFGTQGQESLTWAMNTVVPANACEHYRGSRIVAFSTGCVYPLVRVQDGAPNEAVSPGPTGEYAQSCLGRERVFDYYSRHGEITACLYRLNYAIDLRYGVLHDLAAQILAGEPVNLSVSHFNAIWQGDANAFALLALESCGSPAIPLNVTGPETAAIRDVALQLGRYLDKPVTFTGEPGLTYLSDASRALGTWGYPRVPLDVLIRWQARWLLDGGRTLGKPTHFEVNTGTY